MDGCPASALSGSRRVQAAPKGKSVSQIRPRLPVVGVLARAGVIPVLLLAVSGMHMVMFAPGVHSGRGGRRRHPGAGRELLNELSGFPPLVLDLVESHHERLDGNGYPNRVPAGELDLAVRILTVADVYDALTADRVYREAWPSERALALLEDESGGAFDPQCVAALSELLPLEQPQPNPAAPVFEHDPAPVRGRPAPAYGHAAS